MNILDSILFQCRYQPNAAALCAPGSEIVTYARLEKQINNVARRATSLGLLQGNVVVLAIVAPLVEAVVILGLSRLGIVPVSAGTRKLPAGLRVDAILTDIKYPNPIKNIRLLPVDFSWLMGDGRPIEDPAPPPKSTDICRIVLTSGTTGEPRAVALSHRMAFDRILRHESVFGNRLPQCSRIFFNLGFGASLGYLFLLHTLWRGGTAFFAGDRLERTLQAFELYRIQSMIAAPHGLGGLLQALEQDRSLECRLEVVLSAGSLLSISLSEQVRARICPHLVSVYGATETSMIATALGQTIAHVPGGVGYVTPGVSVEIVNESDEVLPPGSEGVVRVASEYAVDGYVADAAETAKAFRDGWFYPGDIGSLAPDGMLVISGREKEVLNIGGVKERPERIEGILTSFPGVLDAAAFGAINRLGIEEPWAAIVCSSKPDEDALRAHCGQHLPSENIPVKFVTVDALPRNEMGKLDRRRLAENAKPE